MEDETGKKGGMVGEDRRRPWKFKDRAGGTRTRSGSDPATNRKKEKKAREEETGSRSSEEDGSEMREMSEREIIKVTSVWREGAEGWMDSGGGGHEGGSGG